MAAQLSQVAQGSVRPARGSTDQPLPSCCAGDTTWGAAWGLRKPKHACDKLLSAPLMHGEDERFKFSCLLSRTGRVRWHLATALAP